MVFFGGGGDKAKSIEKLRGKLLLFVFFGFFGEGGAVLRYK